MHIVDNRSPVKAPLKWNDLLTGRVYQASDGTVLFKNDEDRYTHLGELGSAVPFTGIGTLYERTDFDDHPNTTFRELVATLTLEN